jgi:uncharacterized protein (TIGR02147 family)
LFLLAILIIYKAITEKIMERPSISEYAEPNEYVRDMIRYRKQTEAGFSVHRATEGLRRVSPALVSLVVQKKRNLTIDRVEEFSRLLNLNASEKLFFRNWIGGMADKDFLESTATGSPSRKIASTSILNDWINLYVKDFFQLPSVQKDPSLIEKQLRSVASAKRVRKAIEFLLREGHLRKTLQGSIVIDTTLSVTDPGVPNRKIRQFHKGALTLARQAIDLYNSQERLANTLIVPLDQKRYAEIIQLFNDFAERLQEFAADSGDGNRLYQVLINLSPVGGKIE